MSEECLVSSVVKSTPGSRRVTPSKTLPTEVRTPNSRRERQFGGSVPRISTETVQRVLTAEIKCKFIIIDCRFQYEFSGGHIFGAINCPPSEKLMLMDWLFSSEHGVTRQGPMVLIMHCEFSQCRAPRLATDVLRQYIALGLNTGLEVYVMKGGYSEFFRYYPHWCDPLGYVPMHDHRAFEHQHSEPVFDADAFCERHSLSSQRPPRRTFGGMNSSICGADSPFFQAACSPMDYSPAGVVADLARVFGDEETHDDSSSGASRRTVTISTSEEDLSYDDEEEYDDGHRLLFKNNLTIEESPSRSSSASSALPPRKRRVSLE
jgi:hypothetical protein